MKQGSAEGFPSWARWVVPALFVAVLVPAFAAHETFEEWDGVAQLWGGQMLIEGRPSWAVHFWPPLYGLTLAAGDLLGDAFVVGKVVSLASAAAVLLAAGRIARVLTGSDVAAVAAQAAAASVPLVALGAIQVENHMLEAAFMAWAVAVAVDARTRRAFAAAGVLVGMAGLARYSAYPALIVPLGIALVAGDDRWRRAGCAMLGFLAPTLLWWAVAVGVDASPWQQYNAAFRVFGHSWLWSTDVTIASTVDVVTADPRGYIVTAARALAAYVVGVGLVWSGGMGLVGIVGLARRPRVGAPVAVALAVTMLAAAQALVVPATMLGWIVVLVPFAVAAVADLSLQVRAAAVVAACGVALLAAAAVADVVGYVTTDDVDSGQLVSLRETSDMIRSLDPDPTIMSVHPARALVVDAAWMAAPLVVDDAGRLPIDYPDRPVPASTYKLRHPFEPGTRTAEWLVVDPALRAWLPDGVEIPGRPVRVSADVVVYDLREVR